MSHRHLIPRIREQHLLLHCDASRQNPYIGSRPDKGGDPGRVHQRQGEHLDENGRVIWMTDDRNRPDDTTRSPNEFITWTFQ